MWITVNYTIDLENTHIDQYSTHLNHFLKYLGLYSVVYLGALALSSLTEKHKAPGALSPGFCIKLAAGIIILSIDRSFYLYDMVQQWEPDYDLMVYWTKVLNQYFSNAHTLILLLLIYWIGKDYKHINFYGLAGRHLELKPYWQMFGLMVPLVLGAALTTGFIEYYPTFKFDLALDKLPYPKWVTVAIYEVAYLFNFIQVELLFRGFFVIGLGYYLGSKSVLPMVAIYAALHFGKPIGETISSVFGGYILGILALKSRNIYGGIFIHMGIAGLMELTAWLVKSYL